MSGSLQPHGLYSPWTSLGQNTRVGSLSLLQGIYPAQGLNPGLPHCRRILYQLSHQLSLLLLSLKTMIPAPYKAPSTTLWKENWSEEGVRGTGVRSCLSLVSGSCLCGDELGVDGYQGAFHMLEGTAFLSGKRAAFLSAPAGRWLRRK